MRRPFTKKTREIVHEFREDDLPYDDEKYLQQREFAYQNSIHEEDERMELGLET